MERLTFEGNFCEIARCKEVKCPYDTDCSQKQVWERLKQYEDTKRTPEQIEALEAALIGKAVAQITEFEGLPIARLRELAVADKDGRVIILPCKVYETDGARVYEHTVREVIYETAGGPAFDKNAIGKSIFLTRAETERALAELEGKKDGTA